MNPYYNEQLSNNSFSRTLDGAQSLGQGMWQNPNMWASNPYVAAAGLTVDTLSRPIQDWQDNKNLMEQVNNTQNPEDQYDEQGNLVYNRQGYSAGLDDVENDVQSYWGKEKDEDATFDDAINPLNTFKNYARAGRGIATSKPVRNIQDKLGIGSTFIDKYDKQMDALENKRDSLEAANQRMTNYNTSQTNQRNQRFQSGIDRRRRFNNLNRLNVY